MLKKYKKHIVVLIIAIILTIIGFRFYQIYSEQRDFAKAEQQIDSLAEQIQQSVGKADDIKKDKSCSHASRVYGKGPLGCGVSINLLYKNKGKDGSNEILNIVSKFNNDIPTEKLGRKNINQFIDYSGRGDGISFEQSFASYNSHIYCSIAYTFPVIAGPYKTFPDATINDMQINISCGGSTSSKVYPLK